MESELLKLLEPATDDYNFVIFQGVKGRYNVPPKKLDAFWHLYCSLVQEGRELYIGEHIKDTFPVFLNFMFSFKEQLDIYYETDFIGLLIFHIQQLLLNILEISDGNVICCLLEPDEDVENNGQTLVYFRLHFPYCRVDTQTFKIIRERTISIIDQENILKYLNARPTNNVFITNNFNEISIPLYRSCIDKDSQELKLTHIYPKLTMHNIDTPDEIRLETVFNIENHLHFRQGLLSNELIQQDKEFLLPLFLSVNFNSIISVLKIETTTRVVNNDTIEEITKTLLSLVSKLRIKDEYEWINIGIALYNTFKASDAGLRLWYEFSSDYYTFEKCQAAYSTFETLNYLTYKTIGFYARIDNPKMYNEWHRSWVLEALRQAITLTHVDIANYIYRLLWLDFCNSNKNWYYYNVNKWSYDDNGNHLNNVINDVVIKDIQVFLDNLNEGNQTYDKDLIIGLEKLLKRLKNNTFKSSVKKELASKFYDNNFSNYENKLTFLTCIKNGVIHVYKDKAYFRDGKPEDYLTKCSDIIFRKTLTMNSILVKQCYDWLEKVFPIPSLLDYFLKISASALRGKNSEKKFYVLTGSGDNSKSMIKKLFELTFGTYLVNLPTSLIFRKRAVSSAPSPELVQCKGAKIAFLQEPDRDENFQTGIIKELTGGDMFYARTLHDTGSNIEPTFILFLMCNQIPSIDHYEKAFSNRLRIVPFLSTWVKDPPADEKEQRKLRLFKADNSFVEKIPLLAPAFLWILLNYFDKYCNEGLKEPVEVTEYTRKYWEENNMYRQFYNECIIRDDGSFLSITSSYNSFKRWMQDSYPKVIIPNKMLFREQMCYILGNSNVNGWDNYILKDME